MNLLSDEEQKELTTSHMWHVLRMNEYIQAPESATAHYIRGHLKKESEVQRWMVRTDAACFRIPPQSPRRTGWPGHNHLYFFDSVNCISQVTKVYCSDLVDKIHHLLEGML